MKNEVYSTEHESEWKIFILKQRLINLTIQMQAKHMQVAHP